MRTLAEKITENVLMTAIARLAMAVALPVSLATAGTVLYLWQDVAVIKSGRELARADIVRRLERLESNDRADSERTAQMRETLAAILATQVAMQRQLDRIEAHAGATQR